MKKLWNVAGDFMPDGLFIRTRKRWQCWKLRWFVENFRPDICLPHGKLKIDRAPLGFMPIWHCDECAEECAARMHESRMRADTRRLEAEALHSRNTEEILEALKHCKGCK